MNPPSGLPARQRVSPRYQGLAALLRYFPRPLVLGLGESAGFVMLLHNPLAAAGLGTLFTYVTLEFLRAWSSALDRGEATWLGWRPRYFSVDHDWSNFSYVVGRLSRRQRFLCPGCLHFGDFEHPAAPGVVKRSRAPFPIVSSRSAHLAAKRWRPGSHASSRCHRCRKQVSDQKNSLADAVVCSCGLCGRTWNTPALHERRVRVVGVVTRLPLHEHFPGRLQPLFRAHDYQCFDNGKWLTYFLHLSQLSETEPRLPGHALYDMGEIWVDPTLSRLELGQSFDLLERLLPDARRRLKVWVDPDAVDPALLREVDRRYPHVRSGKAPVDLIGSASSPPG